MNARRPPKGLRLLGLTGGIAAGKSASTALLRRRRIPVFDTDAEVFKLTADPEVIAAVGTAFLGAVADGRIDRAVLRTRLAVDATAFRRLEALYAAPLDRALDDFLARARRTRTPLAVVDAPLLYECGWQGRVHAVLVVHCPNFLRRVRALRRPGWTADRVELLESRQLPAAAKVRRADAVLPGGLSMAAHHRALTRALKQFSAGKPQ